MAFYSIVAKVESPLQLLEAFVEEDARGTSKLDSSNLSIPFNSSITSGRDRARILLAESFCKDWT